MTRTSPLVLRQVALAAAMAAAQIGAAHAQSAAPATPKRRLRRPRHRATA